VVAAASVHPNRPVRRSRLGAIEFGLCSREVLDDDNLLNLLLNGYGCLTLDPGPIVAWIDGVDPDWTNGC